MEHTDRDTLRAAIHEAVATLYSSVLPALTSISEPLRSMWIRTQITIAAEACCEESDRIAREATTEAHKAAVAFRRAERLTADGWQEHPFEALMPGDVFRLFAPDGTPVDGGAASRVVEAPTPCDPPGNYALRADPVTPPESPTHTED